MEIKLRAMRVLAILLFILISISPIANAYPEDQLKECIMGSKQNPIILGVPEDSIRNYCNCALELIVDEGQGVKESANQCGSRYFK